MVVPNLGPDGLSFGAERGGMFGPDQLDVGVVVDLDQVRAPPMSTGKRELRQMLTEVLRLWGQFSAGPSGVFDQSSARIISPMAPPPESALSNAW